MECRKCMYFSKMGNTIKKGNVMLGLCKLRNRYVTDKTINNEKCKDRAVFAG